MTKQEEFKNIESFIKKYNVKNFISILKNNENINIDLCLIIATKFNKIEIAFHLLDNYKNKFDNKSLLLAAEFGHFSILNKILKHPDFNPTIFLNSAIIYAYNERKYKSVTLLWYDKRVTDTLLNDNPIMYNKVLNYITKEKLIKNIKSF